MHLVCLSIVSHFNRKALWCNNYANVTYKPNKIRTGQDKTTSPNNNLSRHKKSFLEVVESKVSGAP